MSEKDKIYWFKRKRYGYGWIPSSWQGWATMAGYLLVVLGSTVILRDVPDNTFQAEAGYFLGIVTTASIALVIITVKKGPKPKWRKGKSDSDNPEEDF